MTLYIILFILLINFFLFSFNKKIADKINLYDIPDARKLHKKPVSLNGGIFYFINISIIFVIDIFFNNFYLLGSLGFENEVNSILTLFVIFFLLLLGVVDDKISLKPISKTLVSLIIFFIFLSIKTEYRVIDLRFETFNLTIDLLELSLVFTILCFMFLQIILNLYDGVNLQSSLYYSIILIHLITLNKEYGFFIVCVLTLIYLLYFSINNHRSNIFLGDNGVYIFSFILSLLIIKTYQNNNVFLIEEIFVILFVPTVDAIRLFFTRLIKNKNPLKADRAHLHHILLKKYGLIKANILLVSPLISSILLMNFSKLNIIIIIFMNGISYLYLLKNK